VEAETRDGTSHLGFVYNAELLLLEDEPRRTADGDWYRRLLEAAPRADGVITKLRVLSAPGRDRQDLQFRESPPRYGQSGPAASAAPAPAEPDDEFKRFTAFANDRRVTAELGLLPGTYATTAEDARHVRTGLEAAARYALPNPAPASHLFTIRPLPGTLIQIGTAQPAFDQPGGGVEVLFPTGTDAVTVSGPERIPDR
jgi:hypothetical protein